MTSTATTSAIHFTSNLRYQGPNTSGQSITPFRILQSWTCRKCCKKARSSSLPLCPLILSFWFSSLRMSHNVRMSWYDLSSLYVEILSFNNQPGFNKLTPPVFTPLLFHNWNLTVSLSFNLKSNSSLLQAHSQWSKISTLTYTTECPFLLTMT